MGIVRLLFGGNPADELSEQQQALEGLIARVSSMSGPLSTPVREELIIEWLGNFDRNLGAATAALSSGRDMRMQPIDARQVAAGVTRMCTDYGQPKLLERLGQVCDTRIQKDFGRILKKVGAAARRI